MLNALALTSGQPRDQIDVAFRTAAAGETAAAAPDDVLIGIESVIRHVQQAPIAHDTKPAVIEPLKALLATLPPASEAAIQAWHNLRTNLPVAITDIDRIPVVLPLMPEPQEAAWSVILEFDDNLNCHWSLIGGQMVAFICAEHGYPVHRSTDDGDIVLGVWLDRSAFRKASRLLNEYGFNEDKTSDGYGYRYRRDLATIDLLLPEEVHRQKEKPTTTSGRHGLEVPGGNQALIRSERLPVQLGERVGFVRRPNLLGALVAKAAAAQADNRDPDRHREDIAILGQIALNAGEYRSMRRASNGNDRKRLKRALELMPDTHVAWRQIAEPREVLTALHRLAAPLSN